MCFANARSIPSLAKHADWVNGFGRLNVTTSLHEQFERPEPPLPSDRSTGLVFAAMALIAAYFCRTSATALTVAIAIAGALTIVSLLWPLTLRPINVAWMRFAVILSKVMNPIVMLVLFTVAIIPAGLLMQLMRDPLRRRRAGAASYWISTGGDDSASPSSMKNQF